MRGFVLLVGVWLVERVRPSLVVGCCFPPQTGPPHPTRQSTTRSTHRFSPFPSSKISVSVREEMRERRASRSRCDEAMAAAAAVCARSDRSEPRAKRRPASPKRRPRSPCAVLPCLGVVARLPAYPPASLGRSSWAAVASPPRSSSGLARVQTADPVRDDLVRRRRWAGGPVCTWGRVHCERTIGKGPKKARVSADRPFPACGAARRLRVPAAKPVIGRREERQERRERL